MPVNRCRAVVHKFSRACDQKPGKDSALPELPRLEGRAERPTQARTEAGESLALRCRSQLEVHSSISKKGILLVLCILRLLYSLLKPRNRGQIRGVAWSDRLDNAIYAPCVVDSESCFAIDC